MSIGNVFQVDVQKLANGVYWTNVWHILSGGITEAHATALEIAAIEAKLLPEYAIINLVRTTQVGGGPFVSEITQITGSRSQGVSDSPLPYFNRYLLSLNPQSGYHGKKFLLIVRESDQDNGALNETARTYIGTNVAIPLEQLNALCSPEGVPYISVSVSPRVAMRQLRRARKRTTPVIPA